MGALSTETRSSLGEPSSRSGVLLAEGLGCGLLVASSAIHLDLYLTGYRFIPQIGVLFLLQTASGFALAVAVALFATLGRKITVLGIRAEILAAVSAAVFAASTLGGYLLSLSISLFGFKETRTTAGVVAAVIEIVAVVSFTWAVAARSQQPRLRRLPIPLAALAVILLVVAETAATVGGPVVSTGPHKAVGRSQVVVVIKNFAFRPDAPTVHPGERILVKNEDSVAHTFSTAPGAPAGQTFSSGAIPPGGSKVVVAPSVPGTYHVICLIHQYMTLTLTVAAST
jgi:plastocyanin